MTASDAGAARRELHRELIHAGAAVAVLRREMVLWLDDHQVRGRWPIIADTYRSVLRVLAAAPDTAHLVRVPGIADHASLRQAALEEAHAQLGDETSSPATSCARCAAVRRSTPSGSTRPTRSMRTTPFFDCVDALLYYRGWQHVPGMASWSSRDGGRSWFGHLVPR